MLTLNYSALGMRGSKKQLTAKQRAVIARNKRHKPKERNRKC